MRKQLLVWGRNTAALLVYTLGVTAFFLWLLFPSDFFRHWICQYVQSRFPQYAISISQVDLHLPGKLFFSGITVQEKDGKEKLISIDEASFLPDITEVMQSGSLGCVYKTSLYGGSINGNIKPSADKDVWSIDGKVQGIRLEEVDSFKSLYQRAVKGTLAGFFVSDYSLEESAMLVQQLDVAAENGAIGLQQELFGHKTLPFKQLSCQLRQDKGKYVLSSGSLKSSLATADFSGQVQPQDGLKQGKINIVGKFQPQPSFFKHIKDKRVLGIIRSQLRSGGGIDFTVRGALREPGIKFNNLGNITRLLQNGMK